MAELILNIDLKNKTKVWQIDRDSILKLETFKDGVKIFLNKNIKIEHTFLNVISIQI